MILGKCNKYLGNFRAFNTPAKFNTNYLSRKSVGQSEKSKRNRTLTPSPDIFWLTYFYLNPCAWLSFTLTLVHAVLAYRVSTKNSFVGAK